MANYTELQNKLYKLICNNLMNYTNSLDECNDKDLEDYISDRHANYYNWSVEKIKVVLSILRIKNAEDITKILSYIKNSAYGWHGSTYQFYNRCFIHNNHCRFNNKIPNNPYEISTVFKNIDYLFLHNEYGAITTYLFGYCLAALFMSKLRRDQIRIPYFLQIACERNSSIYRLIHEIVAICDVNTSLSEYCDEDIKYGSCDYDYATIFPEQSTEKTLDLMLCHRDVPIIIDGYENEKLYTSLIRETVNIPGRTKAFDVKDKFNVLPIFIGASIKFQFKNVFSINLTNFEIDEEYFEIFLNNKQMLASWVLELIKSAEDYYFSQTNTTEHNIYLKAKNKGSFFYGINKRINSIRKKYTELTIKDANNIGFLSYFLSKYMEIFNNSILRNYETKFIYRNKLDAHNPEKLIMEIVNDAEKSLLKLHSTFSPTLPLTVNINTKITDSLKLKQVKKKSKKYAADIVKYYQSYGVSIRILPDAEYKDERYVFSVKLLPGTDKKLISRYADEVRRLLGIEFFLPDISSSSIKIIASEKPLNENNLFTILKSDKFRKSKMEIPYAVGYDIMGEMFITDIAKNYHILIGGSSGSGKSSALHSLLVSIICKQSPHKVKLLLLDFGSSRLKMFNDMPHMLAPAVNVNEIETARQYIIALKEEMEKRLHKLDTISEREYDRQTKKWASIICVIDEFPTFIKELTDKKEYKNSYTLITNILERARKVKIHLIITAQDASKGNIQIKNTNFGASIAFKCNNIFDSKAIIDAPDATNLYGKGAICFKSNEHEGIKRLQGSYMPPEEIMKILDKLNNVNYDYGDIKNQYEDVTFEPKRFQKSSNIDTQDDSMSDNDNYDKELLEKAVVLALIKGKISNDEIKEHKTLSNNKVKLFCRVSYDTANTLLEELAKYGIVREQRIKKQGRPVDSDKALKFLHEHGYTINRIETILNELAENWNEKNKPLITSNNIENTLNQLLPYFTDSETNPIQLTNPVTPVNITDCSNQQSEISLNEQIENDLNQ